MGMGTKQVMAQIMPWHNKRLSKHLPPKLDLEYKLRKEYKWNTVNLDEPA
jgi:hypothetical protein